MIRERYAIWNNKGGVGKSTLTFHLASLYADQHPDENVLVIDMCPQANATMMLLGSGTKGEDALIELETQEPAPTIAGYLSNRIERLAGTATKSLSATDCSIRVASRNPQMPSNLVLVPGDGNLELLAAPISYYANATFPAGIWGAVHRWVRELEDEISEGDASWTVFVDTNPSFSIYTEIAMIAADKLIVPFNADDSSRHAIAAITRLLYGAGKANPVYDKFTFRHRTAENHLVAPRCHLFVGNRFTQYEGAAKAFGALHSAVADELYEIFTSTPDYFTPRSRAVESREDFMNAFTDEVRDFNTAGVVAAHRGELIKNLRDGYYDVHGKQIRVKSDRIKECADSLEAVMSQL